MKSNSRLALAAAVAATLISGSAFALSVEQTQSISSQIQTSKSVKVAAKAAELLGAQARTDRSDAARVIISAVGENHPGMLISTVTSLVNEDSSVKDATIAAATKVSPESASAIIAATEVQKNEKETTVASVNTTEVAGKVAAPGASRRELTPAAQAGEIVTQKASTGQPNVAPQNLYAQPGFDGNRP